MRVLAPGVLTSEFWTALAALAGKVVVLLVAMKAISATNQDAIVQNVTQVVLAVGTIWGLAFTASKYGNDRTRLKAEAMRMAAAPAPTRVIDLRTKTKQPGL